MVAAKRRQLVRGVRLKLHLLIAFELDNEREQAPLVASIDRANHTATGRGVNYFRIFFITEQRLTEFDPVTFNYEHGWLHADVVIANDGE